MPFTFNDKTTYLILQLPTILARLGHSETYEFGLELQTALAKAIDEASSYLTPNITTGDNNVVFHSEWDNLNKITTNIHGSNVVNSAAGIMIQDMTEDHENTNIRTLPLYERSSKLRSMKIIPPETLPELVFRRVGPTFPHQACFIASVENQLSFDAAPLEFCIYIPGRHLNAEGKQTMPGFGGVISCTGEVSARMSKIDFYNPIHQPITDNAVVYQLL